LTDKISNSF